VEGGRIVFQKQVFSGVSQVTEIIALPHSVRRYLFEVGVPKYCFDRRYSADMDLSIVRLERRSPLVRFGSDNQE
jgi:hypothetical protein